MTNNETKTIVFANESNVKDYSARQMKSFSEFYSIFGEGLSNEGLGMLTVYGALGNSYWDQSFSDYTDITSEIERMIQDEDVKCIALVINSPGGMASGMFDCCKYIKSASEVKPIYAYITGEACSAAYAIASSCTKVYMSEDAETGCCGCYAHVLEYSEESYKKEGFLHRVFRSKNAPRKNLSVITNQEEAKAYQEEIDRIGDEYLSFVANNRCKDKSTAEETFGKGAVVNSQYALENGMVDALGTIEDCINDLIGSLHTEGEGEVDMDIKSMSAEQLLAEFSDEQKSALATSFCASNPSLSEEREKEVRKAERERLTSLNALRNGSDAINAIVDAAVEDGKEAKEIALDVVKAMQEQASKENSNNAGQVVLQALAKENQEVNVPPTAKTDDQLIEEMAKKLNEERAK